MIKVITDTGSHHLTDISKKAQDMHDDLVQIEKDIFENLFVCEGTELQLSEDEVDVLSFINSETDKFRQQLINKMITDQVIDLRNKTQPIFEIGDCVVNGYGQEGVVITNIPTHEGDDLPIEVKFDDGATFYYTTTGMFSYDYDDDDNNIKHVIVDVH